MIFVLYLLLGYFVCALLIFFFCQVYAGYTGEYMRDTDKVDLAFICLFWPVSGIVLLILLLATFVSNGGYRAGQYLRERKAAPERLK